MLDRDRDDLPHLPGHRSGPDASTRAPGERRKRPVAEPLTAAGRPASLIEDFELRLALREAAIRGVEAA